LCAAILLLQPLATTVASQTGSYHWARKVTPFSLRFGNNVSGSWSSYFSQALSEWNKNDTIALKAVGGTSNPSSCSPSTGMVEVCSGSYGTSTGWLGLTRLFFNARGDHIESVTVQMNDSFLFSSGSQYNDDGARRHTICHEIGHSLGLDHKSSGSCMNDSQQAVFDNVRPTKQDFAELARIYQHKDSTTTVAGSQKRQKNKKNKKKGKKGKGKGNNKNKKNRQANKRDRNRQNPSQSEGFFSPTAMPSAPGGLDGTETMTVETLADGRKVITFVTWAGE
jgi:hypothetical protein